MLRKFGDFRADFSGCFECNSGRKYKEIASEVSFRYGTCSEPSDVLVLRRPFCLEDNYGSFNYQPDHENKHDYGDNKK